MERRPGSIPFPDHPSATTMRRVWAVALMRVYQHAIDYHAHEEGPEWAKYLRALAFEREWDKRAADGCVKAHLRRKRDRETGDWRRR